MVPAAAPAAQWAPQRPGPEEPGGCSEEDGAGTALAPRPYEPLGAAAPRGVVRATTAALAVAGLAALGTVGALAVLAAKPQEVGDDLEGMVSLEGEVEDPEGDREKPATGCINWRNIVLHKTLHTDTKAECIKACKGQHGCVAANFQKKKCDNPNGVGSGACYLNADLCEHEHNDCWDLTEMDQVTHTVPWSLGLKNRGCRNFKGSSIGHPFSVWNVDQCGQRCQDNPICVSFHYQHSSCHYAHSGAHPDAQSKRVVGKGTCFLLKKYCDPEPNPCWDGYFMDKGARASEVHLTQAANAGDTEVYVDSIHGLKIFSHLIFSQDETKDITSFHPIVLDSPLAHDYAVGSAVLVAHDDSEPGMMDQAAVKINGDDEGDVKDHPHAHPDVKDKKEEKKKKDKAHDGDGPKTHGQLAPGQIVHDTKIGYELFAENTGKRWCRGPDLRPEAEFVGGEDQYTSGQYEHIPDIPTVDECAAKCTETPWCLGFNWKHSSSAPGFEEGACQLVSQMRICQTDIQDLDAYTKGVYVVTPGEPCPWTPLNKEQCEEKAGYFGQTMKLSSGKVQPTIVDAPTGCYRDAENYKFYWGDAENQGDCSSLAPCLCA